MNKEIKELYKYPDSYLTDKLTFALDLLEFKLEKELYYEFDEKEENAYIYIKDGVVIHIGEKTNYDYTLNYLVCICLRCEYDEVFRAGSIVTLYDLMRRDGWV